MSSSAATAPTDRDPYAFVAEVRSPGRRRDAGTLIELLSHVTGERPVMWGPSIVGFGAYRYRYESGREGEMAAAGFSPRSAATVIYLADGTARHAELLARLGPHTTGVSCLYLRRLEQVDLDVLEQVLRASYDTVTAEGFGSGRR